MSWNKKSIVRGSRGSWDIREESIALGVGLASRYTSEIDWIPPGVPFTVITNSAAVNTSASGSDQLYAGYESGGTFYQIKDKMRDTNYADNLTGGVDAGDYDTAAHARYVDPAFVGNYPFWKIRYLQAGAETSTTKLNTVVIVAPQPVKSQYHGV